MSGAATVVFANQKGGVGKTTLARELGVAVAASGRSVLLVDADPQGNLTKSLLEDADIPSGLYEALSGDGEPEIVALAQSLSLLGGDARLASLEKTLVGELDGYLRLRRLLEAPTFASYQLILIDSPPSLGLLSVNALVAATHLLIPMTATVYALQGTNDLLATVSKVRASFNAELSLLGVIVNSYDSVPVIGRQLKAEIDEAFGGLVFPTVLSKSVKLEESIARRRGVIHHDRLGGSRVKREVEALAAELLDRLSLSVSFAQEASDGKR